MKTARPLSYSLPLMLLLSAAAALPGAYTPAHWRYRQKIATAGPVTRVTLDRAVYDGAAPGLEDLRVIRDSDSGTAGTEVPYLLAVLHARRLTTEIPVRIVNKETRAGTLYVTLEFDAALLRRQPHNRIELNLSREDFRSQLAIEASDDGRHWATVRQSAYIFRYRADDGHSVGHTTLRYPDSRRRYVRLAIAGWPDPAQFQGATALADTSAEGRRSEVWASAGNPAAETKNRNSCSVLDTGTLAPRDRADLTVAGSTGNGGAFHRSVTVEASSDARFWTGLSAGAIYRIADEESMTLHFPETRLRFQRLCIFQGDDAPVRLVRVRMFGIDREVTFRSEASGTYWLYYGAAPLAAAPEYDLPRTAGAEFASAQPGALSAREANPAYQPPPVPVRPWSERYPALLYTMLAIAVGGLGWTALRMLRS